MAMPAYQELIESGTTDRCGAAMLAEQSVAVPFVSALAGAIVVSQCVRLASGYAPHFTITGDAGDTRSARSALGELSARLSISVGK
jgi:hypothetical protein